jgi:hypothetical protein
MQILWAFRFNPLRGGSSEPSPAIASGNCLRITMRPQFAEQIAWFVTRRGTKSRTRFYAAPPYTALPETGIPYKEQP